MSNPRYMMTVYAETEQEMRMVERVLDLLGTSQSLHHVETDHVYRILPRAGKGPVTGIDRETDWDLIKEEG